MLPKWFFRSLDLASSVLGQERHFYFFLFSLMEIGKKCNDEAAKGIEQSQYTKEYRNYFESCHNNAPPFLIYSGEPGVLGSGGRHPVMGTLPAHLCASILYYFHKNYSIKNIKPCRTDSLESVRHGCYSRS